MKQNIFYIKEEILAKYLRKYGMGKNSKDYEFVISLYARIFFEEKLGQKLIIVFEQNSKRHKYPGSFTPNLNQLREILTMFNEENTPVDFALAPINSGTFEGYAYPFQVKRFYSELSEHTIEKLAKFINEKANKYRSNDVSLIIVPLLSEQGEDTRGFRKQELINKLVIDEKSIYSVYLFQLNNNKPIFVPLWASQKALKERKVNL